MLLWKSWIEAVLPLRKAFTREKTFLWFVVILIAFSTRSDLAGVTSFVRALGLLPQAYPLILHNFHSSGVNLNQLRFLWGQRCFQLFSTFLVKFNERVVLIADGLKNPKEGRKMPAIKSCHQESSNNSKPEYVMAHSCQAICLLVKGIMTYFAIPLACEIHEGLTFSNRDKRTLYDKLILLLEQLKITVPYYFVVDAYYATRKIALPLLKHGQHIVSRVRSNAVAYFPFVQDPARKRGKGRPPLYSTKIGLKTMFNRIADFVKKDSPLPNDANTQIHIFSQDLLWRPIGALVRFVWVVHPSRGRWILLSTDLSLSPIQVVQLYGLRFRIEFTFRQAIYLVGAFGYHLWMKAMDKIKKCSSGQYLHRRTKVYRQDVLRKIKAYEVYIQYGLMALGLMQYLALRYPGQIYKGFKGWYRTINKSKTPSEAIVANALQNSLPELHGYLPEHQTLKKFLAQITERRAQSRKKMAA